jgi:DNA polymerase-1
VLLDRRGICMRPYDDTLVMSFNLDAGRPRQPTRWTIWPRKHLDHQCLTYKEVCGSGQKQIKFNEVPLARATEYAAEDADVTLRLWKRFKARLPMERVAQVYERVDRPLVEVIARMERDGVKVDEAALQGLSAQFNVEITSLEEKICAEAGCQFTIGSPKQLGDILFDKMGLKGGRKGKSGVWSTDVNELERLTRDGVPIAQMVLEWRQLTKLKTTYTDALQQQINRETGRVHTSYSLSARRPAACPRPTPTSRTSRSAPRSAAASATPSSRSPATVVLAADYSQIELRLAAHMADVPQLKERSRAATTFTA